MDNELYDGEKAFWRNNLVRPAADPGFVDIFPTESRGNGQVVKNNQRTGAAQGKGTLIRKAHCRLCGFPNDLTKVDHSGGSIDGMGNVGTITPAVATWNVDGGATGTEDYGIVQYRTNSGCALCSSKNSTKSKTFLDVEPSPWDHVAPFGF